MTTETDADLVEMLRAMIPGVHGESCEAVLNGTGYADITKARMQRLLTWANTRRYAAVGWRKLEGEPDTTKAPWDGKPVILGNRAGSWTGKYEPVYQSGYRPENPWFSLMLNCRHMGKYPSLGPTHWQPLPEPPNHPATETREAGRG